jgi:hypothetical protein
MKQRYTRSGSIPAQPTLWAVIRALSGRQRHKCGRRALTSFVSLAFSPSGTPPLQPGDQLPAHLLQPWEYVPGADGSEDTDVEERKWFTPPTTPQPGASNSPGPASASAALLYHLQRRAEEASAGYDPRYRYLQRCFEVHLESYRNASGHRAHAAFRWPAALLSLPSGALGTRGSQVACANS